MRLYKFLKTIYILVLVASLSIVFVSCNSDDDIFTGTTAELLPTKITIEYQLETNKAKSSYDIIFTYNDNNQLVGVVNSSHLPYPRTVEYTAKGEVQKIDNREFFYNVEKGYMEERYEGKMYYYKHIGKNGYPISGEHVYDDVSFRLSTQMTYNYSVHTSLKYKEIHKKYNATDTNETLTATYLGLFNIYAGVATPKWGLEEMFLPFSDVSYGPFFIKSAERISSISEKDVTGKVINNETSKTISELSVKKTKGNFPTSIVEKYQSIIDGKLVDNKTILYTIEYKEINRKKED